jgi:hypothetical protein
LNTHLAFAKRIARNNDEVSRSFSFINGAVITQHFKTTMLYNEKAAPWLRNYIHSYSDVKIPLV